MTPAQQLAARRMYGGEGSYPSYMDQEVLLWTPEKITLKTYDLFIVSAKRNDTEKMKRVLNELMNALNFEHEEIATRLYRLYEYCLNSVSLGKTEQALSIVQELRNSWAKAHNLE
jgi:flagellar protein FliS